MKPYFACNLLAVAKPLLLAGIVMSVKQTLSGEAAAIENARMLTTAPRRLYVGTGGTGSYRDMMHRSE